jgi:hypothetical protein
MSDNQHLCSWSNFAPSNARNIKLINIGLWKTFINKPGSRHEWATAADMWCEVINTPPVSAQIFICPSSAVPLSTILDPNLASYFSGFIRDFNGKFNLQHQLCFAPGSGWLFTGQNQSVKLIAPG